MSQTDLCTPTAVKLPLFVAIAFHVMPRFLEAVRGELWTVMGMIFSTSLQNSFQDPERGEVEFDGYGNSSLTFLFSYRHGDEGTRGSLNRLDEIIWRRGDIHFTFKYLEHYCGCRNCHGMKYPFLPPAIDQQKFEHFREDDRLAAIRRYVGTL